MSRHDRSKTTMRDLIAEAERREISGAEWMDRAGLVRALEATDESVSVGALARARRFLGQVTGLGRVVKVVRGAIDPARPEPPSLVTDRSQATSETPAPIVLDEPAIAAPVVEVVAVEASIVVETIVEEPIVETPASSELLAGDPSFGGMRVVSRQGRSWLVWRAPASRLAAIGRGSEITLRTVSIGCAIGQPNAEVVVETADELGLALEGVRAAPTANGRQCVAAIGVGRGDGFVAIAHARVA